MRHPAYLVDGTGIVFSTTRPDFIIRTSKLYLPVCRMFFSILWNTLPLIPII